MDDDRWRTDSGSAMETGLPHRAYAQLLLLGAMVPAEVAAMMKWSAPAGAMLLGGTLAAGVTSEVGPRAWARIRGNGLSAKPANGPREGSITLRLSPATNRTRPRKLRRETIETALRRVCRRGDAVSTNASGEFIVELEGWPTINPEAIGRRMALAVGNRLDVELTVVVERRPRAEERPAVAAVKSPARDGISEGVDGYSLRRNIFGGEPDSFASSGGEFFRRARARFHAFAPVAA